MKERNGRLGCPRPRDPSISLFPIGARVLFSESSRGIGAPLIRSERLDKFHHLLLIANIGGDGWLERVLCCPCSNRIVYFDGLTHC